MSHNDYLTFEEFNRRLATPHSHTTPAAVGIAVIAGVATLFKFLDFLGYPVWAWIRQFAHKMALELVRAVSPTPSLDSVASDDTVQSGGMMGSLFGMGASALSKGVRGVASALSRGPSDVPPGLGNYDNSCYQNSVIQGLASLPSLRDYLEKTTAEHKSFTSDTTNGALLEMIRQLNDPEKRGQHFWIRGKLKSMSTFTQQDAQEYYSRILDELDKELKKATPSKSLPKPDNNGKESEQEILEKSEAEQSRTTPIPLEGSLAQRVGCTTCGYSEGLSLIPFNCITVSLGRNRSGYDVRELLDEHTGLEYIEGVECSKCTLLKKKATLDSLIASKGPIPLFTTQLQAIQEALDDEDLKDTTMTKKLNIPKKNWIKSEKSKQVVIARAPKSLVLHINRSIFDETTFSQYKNNAGVAYPSTLDLGKWCLGAKPSGSLKPDLDPKTEEWPRDPKESMLAGVDDSTPSPFQYKLRAAVTHFGTHGNGHYVCYRPHPRLVRKPEEQKENDKDTEESDTNSEGADAADKREQQGQDEEANEQSQGEEEEEEETEPLPAQLPAEQWYRFSDDTVYAISEREAHQGNVFMLFYERIDEDDFSPPPFATQPVTESVPLPPSTSTAPASADEAANVAVPSNDTVIDLIPQEDAAAQAKPVALDKSAEGAKDPEVVEANPKSEKEADVNVDAHSEVEIEAKAQAKAEPTTATPTPAAAPASAPASTPSPSGPQLSPHTMRTAGNQKAARGQGSRKSLPLVSAT